MLEKFVVGGYSRGYQFRYTPFDDSFNCFRVFQLITNGNPVAGFYQFMKIGV
jgi:hypothetical protein